MANPVIQKAFPKACKRKILLYRTAMRKREYLERSPNKIASFVGMTVQGDFKALLYTSHPPLHLELLQLIALLR